MAGKLFLVTGTGKYFKNVVSHPDECLGVIRISEDGEKGELLWGYSDGGRPTSELPSHLMGHQARLKIDPENRVVMHCHPTHLLALTYVLPLDSDIFTKTLWQMSTECIVVFPEGIEVLPWMLCGTNEIGEATAEKFKKARLVVWSLHGIYACGKNLDETFGLIETVEKASEVYCLAAPLGIKNLIKDDELMELVKLFKVTPRERLLK